MGDECILSFPQLNGVSDSQRTRLDERFQGRVGWIFESERIGGNT